MRHLSCRNWALFLLYLQSARSWESPSPKSFFQTEVRPREGRVLFGPQDEGIEPRSYQEPTARQKRGLRITFKNFFGQDRVFEVGSPSRNDIRSDSTPEPPPLLPPPSPRPLPAPSAAPLSSQPPSPADNTAQLLAAIQNATGNNVTLVTNSGVFPPIDFPAAGSPLALASSAPLPDVAASPTTPEEYEQSGIRGLLDFFNPFRNTHPGIALPALSNNTM